MDDECEMTGLRAGECAHCKGVDLPNMSSAAGAQRVTRDAVDSGAGPTFLAKFDGLCPACQTDIAKGENARMLNKRAHHAECV